MWLLLRCGAALLLLGRHNTHTQAQREDLCQLMFEVFSVRGLFVEAQATLALYACNKLTGVAVDCGHGTCDVAPVVDGVVQHAAAQRLMYGGEDVTRRLGRDVAAEGDARLGGAEAFETHDEGGGPPLAPALAAAQELKELCARVAPTRAAYLAAMGAAPSAQAAAAPGGQDGGQGVGTPETFSLPDGRSFTVGERTRLTAGEALFDPSLLGMASDLSLPQAVCQAVGACGAESRKALWEAIVPCGGSTQAAGFVERLRTECAELAPMSCPAGIVRHAEYMPAGSVRHASWLGGAILAKIVFAQNHHMTKYEYDEVGPHAIHRKAGL